MGTDDFTTHRDLLVGVAYRMLGSAAAAEDVVQDAWLRWSATDRAHVDDPRAYLVTVTSRLAIDRLRRERARRETYVGEWLPEPVSTGPDAAEAAEVAESVELALLVVLETLSPLERAVFVLHEAFALPYGEIGEIVGRDEAAARQLGHRAREHVRRRQPRFEVDPARRREVTQRFLDACYAGDIEALSDLFVADVHLVADGGGKARAPRRTVVGAAPVAKFLTAIANRAGLGRYLTSIGIDPEREATIDLADINGSPGLVVRAGGRAITVLSLLIEPGGRIAGVYLIANPDKLAALNPAGPPAPPAAPAAPPATPPMSRRGGPGASEPV